MFLGAKPKVPVDPILREESPETQFRKMMIACICLALHIFQSSPPYFSSLDLHNHAWAWCGYQDIGRLSGYLRSHC